MRHYVCRRARPAHQSGGACVLYQHASCAFHWTVSGFRDELAPVHCIGSRSRGFPCRSKNIPWLILATEEDFFTPADVRPVYEEARRWYGLFGIDDKVTLFMGPGKHGTPVETREQLYAFMIRWLRPEGSMDPRESDVTLCADHQLQVTNTGQVEFEEGSRWLHQVIRDCYESRKRPSGLRELMLELHRLGVTSKREPPPVTVAEQAPGRIRLQLESEPGVSMGATLYAPNSRGRKAGLLLVKDAASVHWAETAAARGHVALELEPRDSPKANDKRPFLGELDNEHARRFHRTQFACHARLRHSPGSRLLAEPR
jgi:hypothetical protein